jgi:hypothetical protein
MATPAPLPAKHILFDSVVFRWKNQTLRIDFILAVPVALCLAVGIARRRVLHS